MQVTAQHLAKILFLSEARVSELRKEGKIKYANSVRKLYDLEKAVRDYDQNTQPGFALRHAADKLAQWATYANKDNEEKC